MPTIISPPITLELPIREWRPVGFVQRHDNVEVVFVPPEQDPDEPRETLTLVSFITQNQISPLQRAESVRAGVVSRILTGRYQELEILGDETTAAFGWCVEMDLVLRDQQEVISIVSLENAMLLLAYTRKEDLEPFESLVQWLPALKSLDLASKLLNSLPNLTSSTVDEALLEAQKRSLLEILDSSRGSHVMEIEDSLRTISRNDVPSLWGAGQLMLAGKLLEQLSSSESPAGGESSPLQLRRAIRACRLAAEVTNPLEQPSFFTAIIEILSQALLLAQGPERILNITNAVAARRLLIISYLLSQDYGDVTDQLDLSVAHLLFLYFSLTELGIVDFEDESQALIEEEPGGVAKKRVLDKLLKLGEQIFALGKKDPVYYIEALRAADIVSHLLTRDTTIDWESTKVLGITAALLQQRCQFAYYGFEAKGMPGKPGDKFFLYLRPLGTSRRYFLRNEWPAGLSPNDPDINPLPCKISLESALHVALKSRFHGLALGGVYDAFGMSRLSIHSENGEKEAWKDIFCALIREGLPIFHLTLAIETPNLLWELEYLQSKAMIDHLVLIMLPADVDSGAESIWQKVADYWLGHGISLPPFERAGGFVFTSDKNKKPYVLSFSSLWDGRLLRELERVFGSGGSL